MQQITHTNNLGKSQKIAAIVLAFFALVVFILWGWQFKKSINEPFAYKESGGNEQTSVCQGPECQENRENDLRTKDTDKDGLSDWDELNIYQTSPYLEDSDSDGFLDKEEIDSDNDPNCPTGRDCYGAGIVDGGDNIVSEDSGKESSDLLLENLLDQFNEDTFESEQEISPQTQEYVDILSGQVDIATLRKLLLEAGMDEEALNRISDEELLESYQEMLEE